MLSAHTTADFKKLKSRKKLSMSDCDRCSMTVNCSEGNQEEQR